MPFYLRDRDISSDVSNVHSALILPCRFCPAASLSVTAKKPYIQLFRTFLKTAAYESYIKDLKARLKEMGLRADVFRSKLLHHFIVCMWTSGRRKALEKRAAGYDAVIVLGCDAAVETVKGCTASHPCKVIQGMEVDGIMNVIPSFRFPCNISLEVTNVTRVLK